MHGISTGIKKPQKISQLGLDRQDWGTVVSEVQVETGEILYGSPWNSNSYPPVIDSPVRRAVNERRGNILPAPKCQVKSMLCLPLTTWWVAIRPNRSGLV